MKLFKVTLVGLNDYESNKVNKTSYVVAADETTASNKVVDYMEENNYGYFNERAVKSVELIAEDIPYSRIKCRLFL